MEEEKANLFDRERWEQVREGENSPTLGEEGARDTPDGQSVPMISSCLICQRHLAQMAISFSWNYILRLASKTALSPGFPLTSPAVPSSPPLLACPHRPDLWLSSWSSPVLFSHILLVISPTHMISYSIFTLTIPYL